MTVLRLPVSSPGARRAERYETARVSRRFGDWCVHRAVGSEPFGWTVTHAPCRRRIPVDDPLTYQQAVRLARALRDGVRPFKRKPPPKHESMHQAKAIRARVLGY